MDLERLNNIISNEKNVKILDFSSFHSTSIIIGIGPIMIQCDYCYAYKGNLNEWNNCCLNATSIREDTLADEKRPFLECLYKIEDENNNFFIKSKYMELCYEYKNYSYDEYIEKEPNEINEILKKGDDLLSIWNTGNVRTWNSYSNFINLRLEQKKIINGYDSKILFIKCYDSDFFYGKFNNWAINAKFELTYEHDRYIIKDPVTGFFVKCKHLEFEVMND